MGHSRIEWPIAEVSYKRPTITALRVDRDLGACFLDEEHCVAVEVQAWRHSAPVLVGALTFVRSNAAKQACRLYSHECY